MNVVGQNDDTHNDPSSDDALGAIPIKTLRWVGAVVVALLIGWGLRSWTAANSSQPLPLGPVVENRLTPEGESSGPATAESDATAAAAPVPTGQAATVTIHVAGHVNSPGVYELPANSRVKDAIARAGGVAFDGDGDSINQATWISDGQRIEVPAKLASPAQVNTAAGAPSSDPALSPGKRATDELAQNPIDLNTASAQELGALPGVGPLFGARIVAYRQQKGGFRSVAELGEVPGIGPKRLSQLQPLVTVR